MGAFINLKASDGVEVSAWRADPAGKPRGAVVVIQEIFGVNHHIRAVADFFASQGYLAVAPALAVEALANPAHRAQGHGRGRSDRRREFIP